MERDSAIVVFCSIVLLAVLFWKTQPITARIVTPPAEDEAKPVVVSGPGMIRPAIYAAQPYNLAFLPPAFAYVENRDGGNA